MAQEAFHELVWSDEFNTEGALNSAFWSYDLGTGQSGWGNNEVQSYTQNSLNVRQSGGRLLIEALKSGNTWTSARIKTQGKFSFSYGRVEFKAKLPAGSGTWPALWMLGESFSSKGWPACGEIDVMEYVGRMPGIVHGSLHSPSSFGNTQNTRTIQVPTAATAFHVYAVEWSPESIRFFVDDELFYTYAPSVKTDPNWPFKDDFFIIINLAMGGNFGSDPAFETLGQRNGIDPALTRATLEVDYVRVYRTFIQPVVEGPAYVLPNQEEITFRTNPVQGATYQWEFPDGVAVTQGADSHEVKVNWGATSGKAQLTLRYNEQEYVQELKVRTILKPEGAVYEIEAFQEPEVLENISSQGETFELIPGEEGLRVNYSIAQPSLLPSLTLVPENGLDLTEHTILSASVKTFNRSQTVSVRIDLIDKEGRVTGGAQVFNLLPLISDGEFFEYAFDFSGHQGTVTGQVDLSAITAVRILINYGVFGSPGTDSLWIGPLIVRQQQILTPSRPSNLTVQRTGAEARLQWRDRSNHELGFRIFRQSEGTPWTQIAEVGPNVQTFTDVQIPSEPDLRYRLHAFNDFGTSPFSNEVVLSDVVTALPSTGVEEVHIHLFPNPSKGRFHLTFSPHSVREQIHFTTAEGRQVRAQIIPVGEGTLLVEIPCVPGVYLCRMLTESGTVVKKIIIR
jgi:beta-glucanase (GH16 family)